MVYALRTLAGLCLVAMSALAVQADKLDLNLLIEEALKNNPDLSVLRVRLVAVEAKIPQVGALDDPAVRLEVSNMPLGRFNLNSTPMNGNQLMLSQKLPLPGKRKAKTRVARFATESVRWQVKSHELFVRNAVKQPFYELAYLARAIAVTEKNRVLVQDLVRIARTKYSVGNGLQQDVLKAQVSVANLAQQLITLKTQKRLAEVQLNAVLNRSPQEAVGTPPDTIDLSSVSLSPEDLQKQADDLRPSFKALDQSLMMWQAQAEVAKKNLWPDFMVNLGYRQRMATPDDPVSGRDFLSLGVGLQVPLFRGRKQKQQIVEANAYKQMVTAQKSAEKQMVYSEIQRLLIALQQHRESAELFETSILPQAEQALSSALSGYQVGKVDFLTLLDNHTTLFNYELEHYHHVISHEKRLADLEAVVGH